MMQEIEMLFSAFINPYTTYSIIEYVVLFTLPSLSYTPSETYSILFHLADPDFRAPHLLNTRVGYQGLTTGRTSFLRRKRRRRGRGRRRRRSYHDEITRGHGYRRAIII
jgi:hypothetical protein